MTITLHLIVEDENDAAIIRAILLKRQLDIRVIDYPPTKSGGGISRLAKEITRHIATAKRKLLENPKGCIAVLHDLDQTRQQENRKLYDDIEQICKRENIVLVIARDELESWLLADAGVCRWLSDEVRPRNWDGETKPNRELDRLMRKHKDKGYEGTERGKVIAAIDGSGDKYSESMRQAIMQLYTAPCMKSQK
jgi:hypothetical protein